MSGLCPLSSFTLHLQLRMERLELLLSFVLLLAVGVVRGQDAYQEDSTTSVIIIMGFIGVLLVLSGIGIGCSYLCYRRSQGQIERRARELGQLTSIRTQLQTSPLNPRTVPNWYGPAPDGCEGINNNGIHEGGRRQLLHFHTTPSTSTDQLAAPPTPPTS